MSYTHSKKLVGKI